MSEQMSAEIWIGGEVAVSLVPRLCTTIAEQGVFSEWGGSCFRPLDADDLRAACKENAQGVLTLWLCDDQASWGEFASLEAFLRRHKIAYTRRSDGKWEYEPTLIEYRPPSSLFTFTTNNAGEVVVPVRRLVDALSRLPKRISADAPTPALRAVAAASRELRTVLPPHILPLQPFDIVRHRAPRCIHGKSRRVPRKPSGRQGCR
jgi:hypothetical protein